MSSTEAALWWARARAEGPLRVPSAARTPAALASGLFDDLIEPLGDKQRDALVAAWGALEYGSEPVSEAAVAIPRAEGRLAGEDWQSPHPTTPARLRKLSQVHGQRRLSEALQWLRAAGLIRAVRGADPDMTGASYVPGPALRRLTPAASQRLQENLILAVGPETALATAITVRRSLGRPQK